MANDLILTHEQRVARVDAVITDVLDGLALREAIKKHKLDAVRLNEILASDRDLSRRYTQAMEVRADIMADEIVFIADTEDDAQKARNRIEARKWLAAKFKPKTYGERLDINVAQSISIDTALSEARSRLRPMRDPATIDAQVVREESTPYIVQAPDNQSVPAPELNTAVPDIFE